MAHAAHNDDVCEKCGEDWGRRYSPGPTNIANVIGSAVHESPERLLKAWVDLRTENGEDPTRSLGKVAECGHRVCMRCAIQNALATDSRCCPLCDQESYDLSVFFDSIKNFDAPIDEDDDLCSCLRRTSISGRSQDSGCGSGSDDASCDGLDEEEGDEDEARDQAMRERMKRGVAYHVATHRVAVALLEKARELGLVEEWSECSYIDGALTLAVRKQDARDTQWICIVPTDRNRAKFLGKCSEYPAWAQAIVFDA